MSASEASGGAMIAIGSPDRRTSTKTTSDTTNIDTIDCSNRPPMYRGTSARRLRSAHGLVVRLGRRVGERLPGAHLLAHRPGDRLHAALGAGPRHGRVDRLVVGAVHQQVEGALGVDPAFPAGDRLVVGGRAV